MACNLIPNACVGQERFSNYVLGVRCREPRLLAIDQCHAEPFCPLDYVKSFCQYRGIRDIRGSDYAGGTRTAERLEFVDAMTSYGVRLLVDSHSGSIDAL